MIPPWLRYAKCPCCSELSHVTNFGDADFLSTLLADLTKLWYHIRKVLHPVKMIDGFELICGNNYTREKVEQAISSGWSTDPVHPSKHVYAKTALHLLKKIAPAPEKIVIPKDPAGFPPGRKRTWSDSNRSDGGASSGTQQYGGGGGGSGSGGGGYPTPRSQSWMERRDGHLRGGGGGSQFFQHPPSNSYSRMNDGGGHYADHGRDRQNRDHNQYQRQPPWEGRHYGGGYGGGGGRGRWN